MFVYSVVTTVNKSLHTLLRETLYVSYIKPALEIHAAHVKTIVLLLDLASTAAYRRQNSSSNSQLSDFAEILVLNKLFLVGFGI